jgi:hypothetical protein
MTQRTQVAWTLLLIGFFLLVARADAELLGTYRIATVYRFLAMICFLSSIGLGVVNAWRRARS